MIFYDDLFGIYDVDKFIFILIYNEWMAAVKIETGTDSKCYRLVAIVKKPERPQPTTLGVKVLENKLFNENCVAVAEVGLEPNGGFDCIYIGQEGGNKTMNNTAWQKKAPGLHVFVIDRELFAEPCV